MSYRLVIDLRMPHAERRDPSRQDNTVRAVMHERVRKLFNSLLTQHSPTALYHFLKEKNVETVADACINRIILGECYFKGKYAKNERGSKLLEAKFSVNVLDLLGTG